MIRTKLLFTFFLFLMVFASLLFLHQKKGVTSWQEGQLQPNRETVSQLGLTDLALWTEARYTRHPAMADYFTAFQDTPSAFEHFPAGSIMAPRLPDVTTTLKIRRKSAQQ